jgi:hypothetical protein
VIRRVPAFDDETVCPFEIGDVYQRKLPGIDGRPSFRVMEKAPPPYRQRLVLVTQREVIAEGRFSGRRARDEWRIDWVKQYDRWATTHRKASDAQVLERWRKAHAGRDCWVLMIALLDPVRCMAAQEDILSGRTMRGLASDLSDQYVASGGIDWHAEAVDQATQDRITAGELHPLAAGVSRMERRRLRRQRLFEGDAA